MTCVPEAEALEQHADPLAPLGDAVEPAVQLEVLDRRQLAVDERLVREEADARPVGLDAEVTRSGDREPGADPQERRLPGAVRTGHKQEAVLRELELDPAEDPLLAVPLLEPVRANHV